MELEAIAPSGLHDKVLELISTLPGRQVLDAPAGYGALTKKLLDKGKNVVAADIDIQKLMVIKNENLESVKLDFNDPILSLDDDSFDIAISIEGIEHLQCQWNWVRSLYKALKPGGHLIITTPNILNFNSRMRYFMEGRYEHFKRPLVNGKSWSKDLENYHIAPISFFELQFMLESSGFDILDVHTNRLASKNMISITLRPLFRLIYFYKNWRDVRRNRGDHRRLYKTILSDALFFGECLAVLARKPFV